MGVSVSRCGGPNHYGTPVRRTRSSRRGSERKYEDENPQDSVRIAAALPHRRQPAAIDLVAAQIDAVDLARVGDVLERVRVEYVEVGALARRDRTELVDGKNLRGVIGCDRYALPWSEREFD